MATPYHVRLAVSQYGEQFRAELFTEDLGDTEGDVLTELPPSIAEWVPYLAQGADLPPDAARQLGKDLFAALLHKEVELVVCGPDGPKPLAEIAPDPDATDPAAFAPYARTTREALRKALAGEFDVFHLLAHGHGAGVLLCTPDGAPAETTAGELADWCGGGRTALAFLQVCKAGATAGRGGFGGVAQQLLNPRGGNLSAVVASAFPLDAEYSTQAAVGFYHRLAAGKPPEEAIAADRPETDWCWAFLELWARPGVLAGTQQKA